MNQSKMAKLAKLLPVARSLGGRCLYATQNVENFTVRFAGGHAANQTDAGGRAAATDLNRLSRMYWLEVKPRFFDRLFAGELLGSLRPDITNDDAARFVEEADFALYDAWVDVGHALNNAVQKFGEQKPRGGAEET